jgi:RimJ/RimL family protein N-acetyltransferase
MSTTPSTPWSAAWKRSVAKIVAETERLIIRPWRDEDREDYLSTCNSEAVTAHLGGPATIAEIDAAIERICRSRDDYGYCYWAIERRSDAAFLGYCGLKLTDLTNSPIEGEIEIGWRLREDAWGHGYAAEAARAVLEWAWANTSAGRIVSFTVPANRGSWRLMERLGMTRRPDLDFAHPAFAPDDPLSAHISYVMMRPSA